MQKTLLKNSQGLKFGTYFQQKSPKTANFGLKLLKKAPEGQKYDIFLKKILHHPMHIYKVGKVSDFRGNFIVYNFSPQQYFC